MKRSELKQMIREELINEIGIDEIAAHASAYKLKIELEYILKSTKRFKDALRRTKL